jgi:hypothetical protein
VICASLLSKTRKAQLEIERIKMKQTINPIKLAAMLPNPPDPPGSHKCLLLLGDRAGLPSVVHLTKEGMKAINQLRVSTHSAGSLIDPHLISELVCTLPSVKSVPSVVKQPSSSSMGFLKSKPIRTYTVGQFLSYPL